MNRALINRMLVEDLVDQYIRKIQFDPQRSIRKLADLGERLSQSSHFKQFFHTAQHLLERTDSPYYALLQRIAACVDPRSIKTLGINIGLNSWSAFKHGQRNVSLPWTLLFRLSGDTNSFSQEKLEQTVDDGTKLGIHSFLLSPNASYDGLKSLIQRLRHFSDCAFGLFLPSSLLNDKAMELISQTHNLMTSVQLVPGHNLDRVVRQLCHQRCSFAMHTVYHTQEEAEYILNGGWMKQVSKISPFAICVPGTDCPRETCSSVRDYVRSLRHSPRYPAFAMDLYGDIIAMSEALSGPSRFVDIHPDGTLKQYDSEQNVLSQHSLRCDSLKDILLSAF